MKAFDKLQHDWEENAQLDPLWAICSAPGTFGNRWESEAFFETGRKHMRQVFLTLEEKGIVVEPGTALDFGCGVGRLTQAMAARFEQCYGVDISPKMIELAEQYNQFGDQCRFFVNPHDHLQMFADNTFDFIYTFIVLQHMPPELMQQYLREFGRILKTDGVAVFQVPIQGFASQKNPFHRLPLYHPARILNKLRWETQQLFNKIFGDRNRRFYRLRKMGLPTAWLHKAFHLHPPIEMYHLDEAVIYQILKEVKLEILDVAKDTHQEPGMLNGTFIVRKTIISEPHS